MIIAKLRGGLGNQMFIYAFGRYLANKHNTDLKLDISYYENYHRTYELNKFNTKEIIATSEEIYSLKQFMPKHKGLKRFFREKILKKKPKIIPASCYVLDSGVSFVSKYMNLPDNVYLEGLFQSEKFFTEIKDDIKQEFTLKNPLVDENFLFAERIRQNNAISLHVRRGDYITNQWALENLGLCSLEYYQRAINYIQNNTENPYFFLFSDDLEWVKENLKIDAPYTVVDCNQDNTGYEDIRLMSLCNHHIIANSSFSWWGAWLGHNPHKIVIAPKNWFKSKNISYKDIIPSRWILL